MKKRLGLVHLKKHSNVMLTMHSDWLKEVTRFEISNRSALFQLCQWES